MDINDLTIGQAKELSALFGSRSSSDPAHPWTGRYVIVRCHYAGVHAGVLVSADGRSCMLSHSRRLWYWKAVKGIDLSGVATHGLQSDSKVGEEVHVNLTETCEIILTSAQSEESIRGMKTYER